jgi:hypothetical protein
LCINVEGHPRRRFANDKVIRQLSQDIEELNVERRLFGAAHLHTKLFAFSHPQPHVLVGSFNPSGTDPEDDPALIADIGDQDRGHNLLVEIDDPALVTGLVRVARGRGPNDGLITAGGTSAYVFPRIDNPLRERLRRLGGGARLRIAASHFRDPAVARELAALVRRGGSVDVLTHHTARRSPERLVSRLARRGVRIVRYDHPDHLPMHAKFMLADDGGARWSAFGSYNLTRTSRFLNQELLVFSDDAPLCQALDERWTQILAGPGIAP